MLNDQMDKLCNNSKVPNRTNQLQTQIINPLLELTREPCKMEEKRPVPKRSKHVLVMKKLSKTIKRGNPLLKQTQQLCQTVPKKPSSHESTSFNIRDETIHNRTGQHVANRDESSHKQTMLNEVNMDVRIPWLPQSVVKQSESSRVRYLCKKIENNPDRHALQQDLRQNQAYNPFSPESKRMIQDVGNVELFELFDTDP